jgi:hypothetical protein
MPSFSSQSAIGCPDLVTSTARLPAYADPRCEKLISAAVTLQKIGTTAV